MLKKKLDIVIPVYNESDLIIDTINSINNNLKYDFNILICYDLDNDSTLGAINSNIKINKSNIFYIKNKLLGAHGAVMTGIKNSKSEYILVMPADDDYNAKNFNIMIDYMVKENIEVLCPDRFITPNSIINGPFLKFLLVRIINFSLYYLTDIPTKDSTNGFRFFSRKVIENIKIESNAGFTYSIEYLVKSIKNGYKVGVFPAKWKERNKGQSRFRIFKWSLNYLYWYFYAFKIKLFK